MLILQLGDALLKLRKKHAFSQEELAEQIGVTRQTVSNWETGATAPDIQQAKKLSALFSISLDELLDNDIKEMVIAKVSNTEKLAGLIIKILKGIGILLLICVIATVASVILFMLNGTNGSGSTQIVSTTMRLFLR